ncbi:hypothetical protein SPURM210S_03680 [Streptomyces purpurascens]
MDARTLEELIGTLGEPLLRVLTAPADGLATPVSEILLYGHGDPFPRSVPGALVLTVGLPPGQIEPLARDAAAAGVAGLVVRGGASQPEAVAAAKAHGLALLAVDEDAAWHHVHLLLASAIGSRPGPGDGGGRWGPVLAGQRGGRGGGRGDRHRGRPAADPGAFHPAPAGRRRGPTAGHSGP